MRFSLLTLHVNDLEKNLSFYRGLLGMQELRRMSPPNMQIVFLGHSGDVQLELIAQPGQPTAPCSGFSIGFDVEDIEAETKKLTKAGVKCLSAPSPAGPTAKIAFFEGPNGETVELVQRG